MTHFFASITHSVFGDQVSGGASGDSAEGSCSSMGSTHSQVSPQGEASGGSIAPTIVVIDLLVVLAVGSVEEAL